MRTLIQNERGKTVFSMIRTVALSVSVIAVLIVIIRLFWGVLIYDSATDDTVKELASRAISISGQMMNGQENFSGAEYGVRTRKGYVVNAYAINKDFFEITLIDVPKKICTRILERKWTLPTSIYVNDILNQFGPALCRATNKMSFEFSRDLSENVPNSEKPNRHCLSDSVCSGCGACRNGLCQTSCHENEQCSLTMGAKSVCCPTEREADGLCCSFVENGQCCWGRGKCCPFDKPIYTTDGRCVSCYDSEPFAVGENANLGTCQALCPNRVSFGQDNLCMLPICQQDQFMGIDGKCYDCAQGGGIETSETECRKCADRTYQGKLCYQTCPEGYIQDVDGACLPCTALQTITATPLESCSTICPNRRVLKEKCVLTTCPSQTIPDNKGNCVACDDPQTVWDVSAETCAKCVDRVLLNGACSYPCPENTFRSADGVCRSCRDKDVYPITPGSGECSKCPDRLFLNNYCFAQCSAGQFRDALGSCHDCRDLSSSLVLQTAGCSMCPNRSIVLQQNGKENLRYCAPQYCPANYFRDKQGGCHDCLVQDAVFNSTRAACEQCPNRMWSSADNACRLKPLCPIGEVMDTFGVCHKCSEKQAFQLMGYTENCAYCPNRYLFGSWCRTCPVSNAELTNKESCLKCGGAWDNRTGKCR